MGAWQGLCSQTGRQAPSRGEWCPQGQPASQGRGWKEHADILMPNSTLPITPWLAKEGITNLRGKNLKTTWNCQQWKKRWVSVSQVETQWKKHLNVFILGKKQWQADSADWRRPLNELEVAYFWNTQHLEEFLDIKDLSRSGGKWRGMERRGEDGLLWSRKKLSEWEKWASK